MNIDENLLTAACICSRLSDNKNLKYFSFTLWHKLIDSLYTHNVQNPSLLLGCTKAQLCSLGLSGDISDRLLPLLDTATEVSAKIEAYNNAGIKMMGLDDKNYPENMIMRLQKLCPPVLFYAGNGDIINNEAIAAAGSRKPSTAAKEFASKLGKTAAQNGYTLISGGANGIDCIAEYSATANGGNAVLFLAMPLYQRMRSERMSSLIKQNRICLISDHSPTDSFNGGYALCRNKYIYSAGNCAVVCESGAEKGGSYNGAISAITGGWGNVLAYDNKSCYGNQMLILKGAAAVETVDDVIDFAIKN